MWTLAIVAADTVQTHPGWGHVGGPLLALFLLFCWLCFWGTLAAAGVWLYRALAARQRVGFDRAEQILAERFASGEISAEEYHTRLAQLH